jgi:hypothetical protein
MEKDREETDKGRLRKEGMGELGAESFGGRPWKERMQIKSQT